MPRVKCRKWVIKNQFSVDPKREDLDLVVEELPSLKDGGIGHIGCFFKIFFFLSVMFGN